GAVMNELRAGWRVLGVIVPETDASSRSTLINNFATIALGQQIYLEPALVRVLLGELSNPQTQNAALRLLQSGSLTSIPPALQPEVLRAILPYLDVETAVPDLPEIGRRV